MKTLLNKYLQEIALCVKPSKLEDFELAREAILFLFEDISAQLKREGFRDAMLRLKNDLENYNE